MNEPVVVDCDTCLVRSAAACGDCVVTVLLGSPPDGVVAGRRSGEVVPVEGYSACIEALRHRLDSDPYLSQLLHEILNRINGWRETVRTTSFVVLRRYP